MKVRVLATTLAGALAASPAHGQKPQATTQADSPSLTTYGWKAPSSAMVTEDLTKKGNSSKLRYRLEISPRKEGGLSIAYKDYRCLDFHGLDMDEPEIRAAIELVTGIAAAIPDLHVHEDGRFEKAHGIARCIDTLVEVMGKRHGDSNAKKKQLRAAMQSPPAVRAMQEGAAQYWRAWVGAWHDWRLQPGQKRTEKQRRQILGKERDATVYSEHLPAPGAHPECIALKMVIETAPHHFTAGAALYIRELMPKVLDAGGVRAGRDRLKLSYREVLTVVTDPTTMVPRVAEWNRKITLHDAKTEESHDQIERHRYVFDWSGAKSDK